MSETSNPARSSPLVSTSPLEVRIAPQTPLATEPVPELQLKGFSRPVVAVRLAG